MSCLFERFERIGHGVCLVSESNDDWRLRCLGCDVDDILGIFLFSSPIYYVILTFEFLALPESPCVQ